MLFGVSKRLNAFVAWDRDLHSRISMDLLHHHEVSTVSLFSPAVPSHNFVTNSIVIRPLTSFTKVSKLAVSFPAGHSCDQRSLPLRDFCRSPRHTMDLVRGSCSCGRNTYIVEIPDNSKQLAQVFFDNSSSNRRYLASPITAWLRVPFSWFHSTTFSFFPDETHRTIRRTFVSPFDSNSRRSFCGYCGTQLSQWQDDSNDSVDFINLTIGSLIDEDVERLEDLGLLRLEGEHESEHEAQEGGQVDRFKPAQGVAHRGAPWFESIVEDTQLGKIKRQKGGHTSNDGTVEYEWEIFEWTGEDEEEGPSGKRKIGEVEDVDTEMRT